MMASFLQVILSKNKQTNWEKYVFYCSVSQMHINPIKKHDKSIKMTFCDIHINIIYWATICTLDVYLTGLYYAWNINFADGGQKWVNVGWTSK